MRKGKERNLIYRKNAFFLSIVKSITLTIYDKQRVTLRKF